MDYTITDYHLLQTSFLDNDGYNKSFVLITKIGVTAVFYRQPHNPGCQKSRRHVMIT